MRNTVTPTPTSCCFKIHQQLHQQVITLDNVLRILSFPNLIVKKIKLEMKLEMNPGNWFLNRAN